MAYSQSINNKWEKLKQLTLWELLLLLKAACLLPFIELGLRLFKYKTIQTVLDYGLPVNIFDRSHEAVAKARQIANIVRIAAAQIPVVATCLPQSLVLCRLVQLQGIGCNLRLGAHVENGNLKAHAWVEVDGVPVNDTEDVRERFSPLSLKAPYDINDYSDMI